MPIHAQERAPEPVHEVTQETVDAVMAQAHQHCAPSTWDRFAKSLSANDYPFKVAQ